MRVLKLLYITYIIIFLVGFLISPLIAHNPNRVVEFFIMLGWIILPLIVANLWLFGITRIKKYLIRFLLLSLYYPLAFVLFIIITRLSFKGV